MCYYYTEAEDLLKKDRFFFAEWTLWTFLHNTVDFMEMDYADCKVS